MALPTDIQRQVYDLLSKSSNLSFVSAEQEPGARVSFVPGQQVSAQVLTTLPNNLTQVQIGAERLNLALPMAVRPGQTLEMTFVSGEPRSTFAVARQDAAAPPVSLSDASRLLSLLVDSEEIVDPQLRASLQSIGDMLRRSSGEAGVLANLMDEALTYGAAREGSTGPTLLPDLPLLQGRAGQGAGMAAGDQVVPPEQARLSSFEANAAQILRSIARTAQFDLTEAANPPVTPLPLKSGEEVDAAVVGTLPGGRVIVQLAGTSLELVVPRPVQSGDILRLTFITSDPRPLFALQRPAAGVPSSLSEAGRWLSALEHSEGGVTEQQMHVLERLNTVLESLPPDSPAFTAILDEAITYQTVMRGRQPAGPPSPQPDLALQAGAALQANAALQSGAVPGQQAALQPGSGIVLSDDMAKLLQALIKGNRLALLEAINQQASGTGFPSGQQFKGEIMTSLGGGRFVVQVAGQSLEFTLPKGIRQGDMVTLFFVSDEPQPTFLMARFGKPGDALVSETGRWLSGFLGAAGEQLPALETLGILKTLFSEPPTDASQVSRFLKQGLQEGGLFYESHLARWFGGDYPLEDLLREPQGQLSSLRRPPGLEMANPGQDAALAGLKSGSMEVMEAALKMAGAAVAHEGIVDQQALPIVKEQLTALQIGQILFRGDLVPGQRMEWTVREREARRNASGEQERSWETSLTLDMPKLGNVTASLKLDGARVSIELGAPKPGSAERLKAGIARLAEQLEASGLLPKEIGITDEIP
jgi:hypothetical protein